MAASFAAALGKEGRLLRYRAELDQIVIGFMDRHQPEAYAALGDVVRRMLDDYAVAAYVVGADTPEMRLGYRLYTWGVAMHAYFQTRANLKAGDRSARNDVKVLLGKSLLPCAEEVCPTTRPDGIPPCIGRFDRKPAVTYPPAMLRKNEVGAMLLAFDTDERGAVTNARVFASVPSEGQRSRARWPARTQRWSWNS